MSDKGAAYRAALAELRETYKAEMEATIKVLIAVRDDLDTPAKVRVDASRELGRWLGLPRGATEKPVEPPKPPADEKKQEAPLRQELLDAIDKAIGAK